VAERGLGGLVPTRTILRLDMTLEELLQLERHDELVCALRAVVIDGVK
jgi:hypothetical protein